MTGRYGNRCQNWTGKPMQKATRMARPLDSAEHELAALGADRLGSGMHFDRRERHDSRCGLWRRADAEQVSGTDPAREGVRHRLLGRERLCKQKNERTLDCNRASGNRAWFRVSPSILRRVFDLVTAVETHFWWPNLPRDMREIFRVLKTGGKLIIIAEVYKGANTNMARLCEKYASRTGMTLLDVDEHRKLFTEVGFSGIQISVGSRKGWICCSGRKPDQRAAQ